MCISSDFLVCKTTWERTRKQASAQGYVETIFGRRLYLPEINARNAMRRNAAERAAINAPMQGSAADIMKKAMLDVAAWLKDPSNVAEGDVFLTMQVHDELVFEIRADKGRHLCTETCRSDGTSSHP